MSNDVTCRLLVFSGEDEADIEKMVSSLDEHVDNSFEEVCRCHNRNNNRKKYYRSIVCENITDLKEQYCEEKNIPLVRRKQTGKVVFLFPGNGIYQKNMLGILSDAHYILKEIIDEYAACYKKITGNDLLTELQDEYVTRQVQIVVSEIAIATFWIKCGIEPDIMIGHSLGEYAVAAIADVMVPEDIIKMLLARGEILVERMSEFVMMSVEASWDDIAPELGNMAEVAAYNGNKLVTLLTREENASKVDDWLSAKGISHNRLVISGGGHSSLLCSELKRFNELISDVRFCNPNRQIISTVETDGVDMNTLEYWGKHLTKPVRFFQAFERLQGQDIGIMLDIGVTPVLLNMAMQNYRNLSVNWIPSIKKGRKYRKQLLKAAGLLYESGKEINWEIL